jgi:hypothetical protein
LAADRLAFDDSPEAERLRRFDLACGRGLARSLDSLLKLRRAPELGDRSLSDLAGPLSGAGDTLESSATPNETSEPTVDAESMTNEATDAREIATNEPTLAAGVGLESPTYTNAPEQNLTIEPDARENTTNEPTVDREIVTNEATDAHEIVTNEATAAGDNATNEATADDDVGLESPTYVKAPKQNLTNEPMLAAPSGGNDVREMYLARGQERRFTTGGLRPSQHGIGRGSAGASPSRCRQ